MAFEITIRLQLDFWLEKKMFPPQKKPQKNKKNNLHNK